MEFRAHTALICDRMRTWPPKWYHVYSPNTGFPSGEFGILDAVYVSTVTPSQIYLVTVQNDDAYIGKFLCERADVAQAIYDFLRPQVGRPIEMIGTTEFHFDDQNHSPR